MFPLGLIEVGVSLSIRLCLTGLIKRSGCVSVDSISFVFDV